MLGNFISEKGRKELYVDTLYILYDCFSLPCNKARELLEKLNWVQKVGLGFSPQAGHSTECDTVTVTKQYSITVEPKQSYTGTVQTHLQYMYCNITNYGLLYKYLYLF